MLRFTLVISYLTTSSLPWIMDLTFRFPWNIVLFTASDFTSITSHIHNWVLFFLWLHLFNFLELFLQCSPVVYWAPLGLGSFLSRSYIFAFHTVHGVLRQEYLSDLPLPPPVDHVLSELSTMTCLSWVVLHGMAHSFIELDKSVIHVISLISFLWLHFSFCLPSDG